MTHKTTFGRILYTSKKPERMDQERGREWFVITKHGDGSRTLTAHSEIDDAPAVIRDISITLDEKWAPCDSTVRLTVGGNFMGTGWFKFDGTEAECQTFTANEGRVDQRMTLDKPVRGFGNHAIINDSLILSAFDLSKGKGVQKVDPLLLSSLDHRGATGPMMCRSNVTYDFVGEEKCTVGAGTFDALHFRIVDPDMPVEHPPYEIWCTADGDYIFLKGAVTGYMMTYYELMELER